ncbi:MAG TPA: aminotransferase class V-fold PLP-dependent enzyme [Allosphingosinicella sp.]|nr:aminotransferase class V-fold PLP-dependent enzyme [Allosphingosinicella sp.]
MGANRSTQPTNFVSRETNTGAVYLDAAATSPVDPRIAELVLHVMVEEFGNAGSRTHSYGADALRRVNQAREQVAAAVGSTPDEVVFTSGATEADNLAILGLEAHAAETGRRHIVATAIEHKAVLEPVAHLQAKGFEATLVAPDRSGRVDPDEVLSAVRSDTLLVSVMHGNNETGAIQPIETVAEGLTDERVLLHVDAAQTFGRETQALRERRIDLISLSGHKIFAPKGVGALVVRRRGGRRAPLSPLMFGGGQERGLRPGTLPTPLIAGFGLAAELAAREENDRRIRCLTIRSEALAALERLDPIVHASGGPVLPHILSFAVPGVDSEALMVAAKDLVAISNGSACTSASYAPSHVLTAMGLAEEVVQGTVRLSWSHLTPAIPWQSFAERVEDLRL